MVGGRCTMQLNRLQILNFCQGNYIDYQETQPPFLAYFILVFFLFLQKRSDVHVDVSELPLGRL